ncbi:MAG: PhnD/SsuA/transferrin family substrate-binding protein [Nannocystaceae bacterium]
MPDIHAIHGLTALFKLGLLGVTMSLPSVLVASQPTRILVVKPSQNAVLTQQQVAQQLVKRAGDVNNWHTESRVVPASAVRDSIVREHPSFGIVPFATFLALREAHDLELIGATTSRRQFVLVSRTGKSATQSPAVCRGLPLASTHISDPAFVDRVVSAGAWRLGDFELAPAQSTGLPLRQVLTGEAACALVDTRQLAQLTGFDDKVQVVWQSREFPDNVVVAFGQASASERATFRSHLREICQGTGEATCDQLGTAGFEPTRRGGFRDEVRAYEYARRAPGS